MGTTFKEYTKRELLLVMPQDNCCTLAFLSALSKVCGALEGTGRRQALSLRLENRNTAEKVAELFKRIYPTECTVTEEPDDNEKKPFKVTIAKGFAMQALMDFELMAVNDEGFVNFTRGLPQQLLRKECCMKAYLKGLYLGCGSAYVPTKIDDDEKKQGYHFELQLSDEEHADGVMELLSDLRIRTRMSDRNGGKLVYVKDKDEILNILCLLGLSDSASELRNIINDRETANELNRTAICEAANMDKTFAASSRLVVAIARLKSLDTYDKLPISLKETAEARSDNPEASMQELADILHITKSCLHHRLKKIEQLAHFV